MGRVSTLVAAGLDVAWHPTRRLDEDECALEAWGAAWAAHLVNALDRASYEQVVRLLRAVSTDADSQARVATVYALGGPMAVRALARTLYPRLVPADHAGA